MASQRHGINRQEFRERYETLVAMYIQVNPEYEAVALCRILLMSLLKLRDRIANSRIKETSWQEPSARIDLPISAKVRDFGDRDYLDRLTRIHGERQLWPCHVTPASLQSEKAIAECLLENFFQQKVVWAARKAHSGATVVLRGTQDVIVLGPKDYVEQFLSGTPGESKKKLLSRMLNAGPPITIDYGGADVRTPEKSKNFPLSVEFAIRPIFINTESEKGFLPVEVELHLRIGGLTNQDEIPGPGLWRSLAMAILDRYPKEDLGPLRELRETAKMTEIDMSFLVKPEYASSFRDFIKAFGDWQIQHVHRTGDFAQVQGVLKPAEISTPLTERQQMDYKKHDYKCYDQVHILGTTPMKRSNTVKINDNDVEMGDNLITLLLRLVHELKKGEGGWMHRRPLSTEAVKGPFDTYQMYSNLRTALEGSLKVKDGALFIECDGSKRYRLSTHPDFVTYDKNRLLRHPLAMVKKLAKKLP